MSAALSSSVKTSPTFSKKSGLSSDTLKPHFIPLSATGIHSVKETARLTKRAVLPPITSPPPDGGGSARLSEGDKTSPLGNPFVLPPTGEVFTLREIERRQSKQNRAKERMLKVRMYVRALSRAGVTC